VLILLLVHPGRTKDLIKRKVLNFNSVDRVILDEADEMLSMGFKDDLDFILDTTNQNRQTLLFSATMSKEVRSISKRFMNEAQEITVEKLNSGSKNVEHHIYSVSSKDKYATLKRISDLIQTYMELYFVEHVVKQKIFQKSLSKMDIMQMLFMET
jgi:ATP-dependent RNA helicase DeaD